MLGELIIQQSWMLSHRGDTMACREYGLTTSSEAVEAALNSTVLGLIAHASSSTAVDCVPTLFMVLCTKCQNFYNVACKKHSM